MSKIRVIKQFSHCDELVLHSPEIGCVYCNEHPDWQQLREMWGINFTGENDPNKHKCPSEVRRPLENINRWHGNVPVTATNEKDIVTQGYVDKLMSDIPEFNDTDRFGNSPENEISNWDGVYESEEEHNPQGMCSCEKCEEANSKDADGDMYCDECDFEFSWCQCEKDEDEELDGFYILIIGGNDGI